MGQEQGSISKPVQRDDEEREEADPSFKSSFVPQQH
jgi:hypothetical protein